MHTKAIILEQPGGPENLRFGDWELPELAPNQVRVAHKAIGSNMVDINTRKGIVPRKLPAIIGFEAAGEIIAAGSEVSDFNVGDRVCYFSGSIGTYCQYQNVDSDALVKLPDNISYQQAAASLLKGLTARMLVKQVGHIHSGSTILAYAAAGGVGSILCQWAKHLGARVIGVVGSENKVAIAKENGCDAVILRSSDSDIAAQVRHLVPEGVDVVFDSAGKQTFGASLDSLKPTGMMVSYGNTTGPVDPVNIFDLMMKGSLFLTKPTLAHYITNAEMCQQAADELFSLIESGTIKVRIEQSFDLENTADAHRATESGTTTGSIILIP